jgi:hypothetical protein
LLQYANDLGHELIDGVKRRAAKNKNPADWRTSIPDD